MSNVFKILYCTLCPKLPFSHIKRCKNRSDCIKPLGSLWTVNLEYGRTEDPNPSICRFFSSVGLVSKFYSSARKLP